MRSKIGKLSDGDKAFYKEHRPDQTELQEILSVSMIMVFANYSNLNDVAENPAATQSTSDQIFKHLKIEGTLKN
jgi:hypothetical protein